MKVKINPNLIINLPEGYEPVHLPMRDEWIAALTSGEYKQMTGFLCFASGDECRYCCLGVLSKIQGRLSYDKDLIGCGCDKIDGYTDILSPCNPLYEYFNNVGFFPKNVSVTYKKSENVSLASLNDEGATFAEIAEVIKTIWK